MIETLSYCTLVINQEYKENNCRNTYTMNSLCSLLGVMEKIRKGSYFLTNEKEKIFECRHLIMTRKLDTPTFDNGYIFRIHSTKLFTHL